MSMVETQRMQKRSFDAPDEQRPAGSARADIINLGNVTITRITCQPGWRWSTDVKPIAKTDSCDAPHLQYIVSGRTHVLMDNGEEQDFGPGDVAVIPPGHDAWVLGNEPVVAIGIIGSAIWARPGQ
jgi:mannose-6-phosphate isomerase-like protein (cupin superfamily)